MFEFTSDQICFWKSMFQTWSSVFGLYISNTEYWRVLNGEKKTKWKDN